jgi:hypothetical protein
MLLLARVRCWRRRRAPAQSHLTCLRRGAAAAARGRGWGEGASAVCRGACGLLPFCLKEDGPLAARPPTPAAPTGRLSARTPRPPSSRPRRTWGGGHAKGGGSEGLPRAPGGREAPAPAAAARAARTGRRKTRQAASSIPSARLRSRAALRPHECQPLPGPLPSHEREREAEHGRVAKVEGRLEQPRHARLEGVVVDLGVCVPGVGGSGAGAGC